MMRCTWTTPLPFVATSVRDTTAVEIIVIGCAVTLWQLLCSGLRTQCCSPFTTESASHSRCLLEFCCQVFDVKVPGRTRSPDEKIAETFSPPLSSQIHGPGCATSSSAATEDIARKSLGI